MMMMMIRMILKGWSSSCLARSSVLSFLCLLSSLFMYHGQTIIASKQFCGSSYFERLDFCTLVSTSHPVPQNPTQPPVFIAPRNRKMGFLYPKSRYSQIFARFSPVKQSNINRFWNSFHSRIALGKLYNNAAQSLSRHKLRCMKIIIEIFSDDKWFACVSSVVFEAKSIWIYEMFLLVELNNLTPRTTF